jgi:hypothetical protein
MRTAHFTHRNEPCVLVLQMAEVAGSAADKINRPDSHPACILFDKTQLFLHERSIILRHLALNDPHHRFARPRIAFFQKF